MPRRQEIKLFCFYDLGFWGTIGELETRAVNYKSAVLSVFMKNDKENGTV